MSELFNGQGAGPRPVAPAGPPSRRPRAFLWTAVVLGLLLISFTGFASFWTERLWFGSVGYGSVFSKLILTKLGLFVGFGLLMAVLVGLNMGIAYRLRPVFRPASPEQAGLDRYRDAVTPIRARLVVGFALVVGAFAGASGAGQWRSFLLWRHSVPFGTEDPFFNRDVSFYVFELPWYHFLVDFAMAITIISLLAAALVHYLFGGIQLQNRRDRLSPAAQAQLSVLVGSFVLTKAVDYWLGRYDLLTHAGSRFTGMNYTGEHAVLPARNILIGIAVICAVLFFLNVWRRTWMLPSVGLALLVLSSLLMGVLWPGIVQRFQVDPTEADKEAPYIEKNIAATREAYAIGDAIVEPFAGTSTLPDDKLAEAATNNPGIRLVDPRLARPIFEQKQQVRGYYSVADVLDVDRYTINGQERDLILGARELDQTGLPENSKNWSNLHTVYTHGYGVIAAYGNQRGADNKELTIARDEPAWAETDIPPRGQLTDLQPGGYEGRIYFGERSPDYSIVGKTSDSATDVELDLPGGGEADAQSTTTYAGAGGVPINGLFNKLLYAVKFGEANLVLSERVHDNSKILYDREPRLMVEKVAPWLTVDEDPFPAVVDGRVVWILDGYTTTDQYPLSQRDSFQAMTADALAQNTGFQTLPTDEINYMRNAVKATVDAYDGTVTLYAWDEEDPMLKAWSAVFPGTVKPRSDISPGLMAHLRYPEDLFKVQRYQLASYHVTDASDFYERNDQWEVPADPDARDTLQPPYRLAVSTPSGGEEPVYSLTSVFVPAKRSNLAAFLSVDAAADRTGYGTLRLLRLGSSDPINGPGQIANQIGADDGVKSALLPYRQNDSQVLSGNLLTLPIGDGLLYVQPIYVQRTSGEGNYPVLQFVAVSFGKDTVGIGTTFEAAINDLLNIDPNATPEPVVNPGDGNGNGQPTGTLSEQVRNLLRRADAKFQEAKDSLRAGDLAGYQEATTAAERLVNQALALAEQQATQPSKKKGNGS